MADSAGKHLKEEEKTGEGNIILDKACRDNINMLKSNKFGKDANPESEEEEEESEEEDEEPVPIVAKLPIARPSVLSARTLKSVPAPVLRRTPATGRSVDPEYESESESDEDEDTPETVVSNAERKGPRTSGDGPTGNNEQILDEFASGRPIKIMAYREDHQFDLDEQALESILLQDHVKDRHMVVVSVAGAFRKGKSFLLDFLLRYMQAKGSADWMGSDDVPLEGFSWRGGCERDTTGILLWSEVFLVDLPSGEKVGVILMDTQGAFDSESTVRDCATVFALSTMISSVQIYNLSQNIQEDDLQHLQLFTEYGRLALEDTGEKPFQKLQFLVRDWSFPYEADYGAEGGKEILKRRLTISDKQHPELQSLRRHISSCFADISCFLMPHPGLKVATSPNFDGRLSCIENDFKKCLGILVPMILAPENLLVKQISGQKVKAKELLQYFKSYINMYKGNELPEPKSMLVATAEANNLAAVASAKETYQQLMEEVCGGTKPFLSTEHLESEHRRIKDKSLALFSSKRKMGGEEFSEKYKLKLEEDIEEAFQQFRSHNESKNIFKAAKTPAVFFILVFVFYMVSGISGLFGITALANVCSLMMMISFLALATWAYIRYIGEFVAVGRALDDAALIIWDNIMKPFYQQYVESSVRHAAIHAATTAASSTSISNGKLKAM